MSDPGVRAVMSRRWPVSFTDTTPNLESFVFDTFAIRPGRADQTANVFDTSLFKLEFTTNSPPPTQPGDFNGDLKVDATDYVVWRDTIGTQAKYDEWRANFGAGGAAAGSALGTGSVPEPASQLLILAAAIGAFGVRRNR